MGIMAYRGHATTSRIAANLLETALTMQDPEGRFTFAWMAWVVARDHRDAHTADQAEYIVDSLIASRKVRYSSLVTLLEVQ